MRALRQGEVIKFSSMNDLSGKKEKLTGKILGDHEAVRKQFPIECGEAGEGAYLVKVDRYSGFFVVADYEILEIVKEETLNETNINID